MARISEVTFSFLASKGVDSAALAKAVNTAYSKKSELEFLVSQSKASFSVRVKDEIERKRLTDAEDYAMTVAAFDTYMVKGCRKWSEVESDTMQWTMPQTMIRHCLNFWPKVEVPAAKETVKA